MKRIYLTLTKLSWGLLVAMLPITSLPLLSKVMGGTDVAPFSLVFLVILVAIWWIPNLLKGRGLPGQSVPLLIFFVIALISSLLAFFLPIPLFKNVSMWKNEISGVVTLGIGICFYLVTAAWITDEGKLKTFFRIVNVSGAIMLGYALVQGLFVMVLNNVPAPFLQFQNQVSASGTLFVNRVNGLAFEPSWFAHQLNMFYIPIWLGLSIKRISFHKLRVFKITFENILLVVSLLALFLSKSRIGWLAFIGYIAYLFLRLMDSVRRRLFEKVSKSRSGRERLRAILFNAGFWLGFIIALQAVLLFAGWVLTKIDSRMALLFDFQTIQQLGFLGWASRLVFAERIVYWIAGFSVFVLYPIFGVGLANIGFLIPQTMTAFGYSLPEVLRIYLNNTFIPNAKNLWVRILGETGIVGFSVFVAWLWVAWKTARAIERHPSPIAQAMGLTGQIVIVGLIFEGFSLDTFALPYYWITLGLVLAVYRIFFHQAPVVEAETATATA